MSNSKQEITKQIKGESKVTLIPFEFRHFRYNTNDRKSYSCIYLKTAALTYLTFSVNCEHKFYWLEITLFFLN